MSHATHAFTVATNVHGYELPAKVWLEKHGKESEWDGIASGCVVFNPSGQMLLIQRAPHDSMPNRWEIPGGAVDDDDPTILHGAARELSEEAGLVANHFSRVITEGLDQPYGQVFTNRAGTKTWCRLIFGVEVVECSEVKLDPNEHQNFVWASEEEIREQRNCDRELPITTENVRNIMLEAFRLRKQNLGQL